MADKQPQQLAATTGFLDQLAIENETVCLSGWVLSFESEMVTNFKVLFDSKQLTEFRLTQGIPSPGVKKAHPNISAADNARFIIRLPMNKQQQQEFKDSLIILIPLVKNREGEPLLNGVTPALSSLLKTSETNDLPTTTPQVELISVHVPKAAGTAFRQVLLQVYGTQGVLTDKTNMFEDNMPATIHWQTKVIEGHFRAGKYDKLFPNAYRITWLREPIHRLISDYCFRHMSNPTQDHLNKESLLKFAQGNSNLMAYCVNAKSLDYFDFIGITEHFAEDLLELKSIFGWCDYEVIYQNRNPYPEYIEFQKKVLSDKKLMDELAVANSQDMELYEAALNLRKTPRKKLSFISSPLQKYKTVATVGNLEVAEIKNQQLNLSGWAASFNSGLVDSFEVTVAGQKLINFEQFLGLSSPDVKKTFPHLDSAEVARFHLLVTLSQTQIEEFIGSVVALTPFFQGRKGLPLLKVISPVDGRDKAVNYKVINQDKNVAPHLVLPDGKSISFPLKNLVTRVHGDSEISAFLEVGRQISIDIKTALQKIGKNFSEFQSVLDFGCGCGRVIIWYSSESDSTSLYATDTDTEAISWCQKNIKFAKFNVNQALPPLPYEDNQFDFIYLISVFTDINEEMQLKWLQELERITKPGGVVLITTRQLRSPKEAIEMAPKLVELGLIHMPSSAYKNVFPDWYGITLQTEEYVRNKWVNLFEIVDYFPGGIRGNQNIVLLRKNLKENFDLSPEAIATKPEIINQSPDRKMPDIKLISETGYLEKVEFTNKNELSIKGWVADINNGFLENFKVTFDAIEINSFELKTGIPSPDVKKIHSNLHNSHHARFHIKVSLNSEQVSQFQNYQIDLIPIFKDDQVGVLSKTLDIPKQGTFPEDPILSKQSNCIESIEAINTAGQPLSQSQKSEVENQQYSEQYSAIDKFVTSIVVDSFGYLEKVEIDNQKLVVSGWVGSVKFGSVEDFKVVIGGQKFTSFVQELGLPSPDVAKVRPQLNNAGNSRFRLEISLSQAQLKNCQNSLIVLTPIFSGKEGNILFKLFQPSLPIPNDKYIDGGAKNFIPRSFKFLGDFIQRVALQPTAEVLEIGCGIGNIAYGLSYYLQSPGRYEGFDFSEELISWAQQNITTQKPHCNFRQIDSYLPLPYYAKSFDFVFISSRFTQVGGSEIRNYLDEVYRVVKPGGRLLFNCFLVNHESEKLISKGKSSQPLIHRLQEGFTKDLNAPEKGMGFLESLLLKWVNNSGFDVLGKFYGSWCGRVGCKSYLDMLILEKSEIRKLEPITHKSEFDIQKEEEIGNEEEEKKSEVTSQKLELKIEKPEEIVEIIPTATLIDIQKEEKTGNEEEEKKSELKIEKPEKIVEIIPTATSSISLLLTEITADLEKSQTEIQEIKADLEKFKSRNTNTPTQNLFPVKQDKKLLSLAEKTPAKPVAEINNLPGLEDKITDKKLAEVNVNLPGNPKKQKQELLGLSGVTVEKFWEIINLVISIEGKRDFSQPSISILTPTWNSSLDWFVETVLSVLNQSIPDWEWCIVDDGSKQLEIKNVLAGLAEKESRIKVILSEDNGGISAATNKALKMATGEFICLLDHDDTLVPTALENSLSKLAEGFDVVYSDEDKIDFSGLNYTHPFFKPDWSPEYFRGVMYVGHLLCLRREIAVAVGGFKSEFDGVQDYEFMLRVSEQTNKIAHISKHLYHWRQVKGSISGDADAKADIEKLQQAAVNTHLERIGLAAKAEPGLGRHRVNIHPLPRNNYPLISLIIAIPNISENLNQWLENLLSVSSYPENEVILISGNGTDNFIQNPAVKVLSLSGKFNYSCAYNLAAKTAKGEYFVFLNTNLEPTVEDWQTHLLYYAEQSDIGAVGGFLVLPDGTVEDAGIVLGKLGKVNYVMRGFATNDDGYAGSLVCAREVSAVSRKCLMVSRENFELVGGFNEHFFCDYQDVDLCLKLRKKGKRIMFTPRSILINNKLEKHRQENYDVLDYMLLLDKWQIDMDLGDPYYNVNFDIQQNNYSVLV